MTMNNDTLKNEYQRLQEQQLKKLERIRSLNSSKNKTNDKDQAEPQAFGVSDNLGLQHSVKNPNSTDSLLEQIRVLKDENGRLHQLVSEKDFEVKSLKRKMERESSLQPSVASSVEVSGDVAAVRIMNLSKKVRELTAELESERTKNAQLGKKCRELETEKRAGNNMGAPETVFQKSERERAEELKAVKDKLRQAESKILELKSQNQSVTRDLKLATKALSDEIGDPNVNVHDVLNGQSNWRGRQQKVIALQNKVRDLESQLTKAVEGTTDYTDLGFTGATCLGRDSSVSSFNSTVSLSATGSRDKNRENLLRIAKARQEALDRTERDLKVREVELDELKRKLDASKARNKVLSTEMKAMKEKIQLLLEKGRHDDELIGSLMKQQRLTESSLESALEAKSSVEETQQQKITQINSQKDQESRIIERLKEIINDKETQILRLQDQMEGGSARTQVDVTKTSARVVDDIEKTAVEQVVRVSRGQSPCSLPATPKPRAVEWDREELRTLCSAAEVERDKLRELVLVQERRHEDLIQKHIKVDQENSNLRRRCAMLERQVQRSGGSVSHLSGTGGSSEESEIEKLLADTLPLSPASQSDLQRALGLSRDEATAVKQALSSALAAKQEDLRMLSELVSQTRDQFLTAVRSLKQRNS